MRPHIVFRGFFMALLVCCSDAVARERTVQPILISKVDPTYTEQALHDKISGDVAISLTVDKNGAPTKLKVLLSLNAELDQKAIEAVSRWRFKPGTKDRVPVSVKGTASISFQLEAGEPKVSSTFQGTVDAPILIQKTEPQYSEEARNKHLSGTVLLSIVVGRDGVPKNIKIVRALGFGLDEKAIEAVSKWRFRPGTSGGVPVDVIAHVEISFSLCATVGNCEAPGPSLKDPISDRDARAQTLFDTAIHQLRGDQGDAPDPKAAFQTMQKSAAMDYTRAEILLGQFYLTGTGTPVDNAKAVEMFEHAAYQGDPRGDYQLGRLYRTGTSVPKDQAMAMKLFTRAADKDLPEAEYALGVESQLGEGTDKDLQEALKWYRKSAELGFAEAERKLANLYWDGSAGKQDQVAALQWAILAEKSGLKEAAADVQTYRAALPADRIAEAEKRAEHFKLRNPKTKL